MVAQTLDFYSVLGIKKNANDTEIKKAFYKKAREWHPDKNSQPCAEEKFKEVNKAYETLSDANKRRTYDLQQTDATSTKTSTTTKSTPTQQQQKSSNSDFQTTFTSSFHHSGEPHFTFSTTTNGNNNGRFPFHRMDDDNLFSRHSRFPYSFFDSFGTSMNDDFFFNFSDEHNTDDDEDSDDDHHNSTINSDEFDFNLRNERRKMPHQQSRRTHRNRSKWGNSWGMNDNGSATINGDDDNDSITTSLFNTRKFPSMFNRTTSSNPFEMFEMLTKAVFEKFFNDDFFWNHFASGPSHMDSGFHFPNLNETRQNPSRLRTSSQRRPLSPAAHRTKIHVGTNLNNNGSKPNDTHFEWLENSKKRRQTPPQSSFTRFDSDEENEDNKNTQEYRFKKQQTQPSSFPTRLRRRTMADHRIESCQYCFRPLASSENLLQHEAHCKLNRKYPSSMYTMRNANNNSKTSKNDENIFTSSSHVKCNYCHEYICLSDKFDHETLCRRFGPKNSSTYTTTAKDRKYNTTTSPSPSTKSSTLNGMSTDQKKLCQRCKRYFILSDLFNHVCEDEDGDVNNVTIKKHENESYNNRNIKVPLDKLSSTDNKSFNKQSTSSLFNNDQENEHTKYEFDPSTLFSSSQNHYHSNDSPTPSAASSRLSSSSRLSTSSGGNKFSDFTKYQPQNMTKLNRRSSFNPTRTPTPTTTGRQTSRMNISSTKHDNSYSRNNGTKLSSTVNHKNEPVYHIPVMLKRSRSPFHSTGRPSMTNTRTATPTPSPATSTSRFSYSKVDPFPPGVTRVSNYAEPRTTTSPRASSVAYVYIRNPSAVRA